MTDLIAILPLISILIAGASFYFARKHDTQKETMQQAEVMLELRAMRSDVSDMKSDMQEKIAELKSEIKSLRMEYKQDHDDIVSMKRDFATMWERIDELKKLINRNQGGAE